MLDNKNVSKHLLSHHIPIIMVTAPTSVKSNNNIETKY